MLCDIDSEIKVIKNITVAMSSNNICTICDKCGINESVKDGNDDCEHIYCNECYDYKVCNCCNRVICAGCGRYGFNSAKLNRCGYCAA